MSKRWISRNGGVLAERQAIGRVIWCGGVLKKRDGVFVSLKLMGDETLLPYSPLNE